ncbi:MAG TPA: hypothetical protein DD666_08005 [Advenella kashmirensis]|uniref:Uncharacterized protein n=1 Tax=Advenella kashmirensis TaxID=310575 RepID=A0A356LEI3_9BURK|nr:hypothetical protein [Advenella kashmirensis]
MIITELEPSCLVCTTSLVHSNYSDILYVSFDREMNIFMCGDEVSVALGKPRLIKLSVMLEKDNTLLQLPEFNCGDSFFRYKKGSAWEKIGMIEQITT